MDFSRYPVPIKDIWDTLFEGRAAVVLEGNTSDRIIFNDGGLPHPMNLAHAIHWSFGQAGYQLGHISMVRGFTPVQPPCTKQAPQSSFPKPSGAPWENPAAYISPFISGLQSRQRKTLLMIDSADFLMPDGETGMLSPDQIRVLNLLTEVGLSDSFRQSGNILILNSLQGSVNRALLRSGAFRRISVPLPGQSMRLEFISHLKTHQDFSTAFADIETEELSRLTNGCRLRDIECLARKCAANGATIAREDVNQVKRQAILDLSQGQLGVINPSLTLDDLAGMDKIKHFFKYQVMLARKGSKSMPSIILMTGVPGVGKSYSVEAYARELGWTLLEWKNVRSQWVGASEARTEQALELIRQNQPALVWVDEADQMLGGRSTSPGDGGVDARIFGSILAFTGDASMRGRVQWLLTSNAPHLMDAALLDRAGAKLVYLTPSKNERIMLLSHLTGKLGRSLEKDVNLEAIASHANLSLASVRNLMEIIGQAGKHADITAGTVDAPISHFHLSQAVEEFNQGDTLETIFIALHCLAHLRFLDQLPWIDEKGKLITGVEFPPYLDGVVDPQSGRLDPYKLASKLREVEELRARQRIMR